MPAPTGDTVNKNKTPAARRLKSLSSRSAAFLPPSTPTPTSSLAVPALATMPARTRSKETSSPLQAPLDSDRKPRTRSASASASAPRPAAVRPSGITKRERMAPKKGKKKTLPVVEEEVATSQPSAGEALRSPSPASLLSPPLVSVVVVPPTPALSLPSAPFSRPSPAKCRSCKTVLVCPTCTSATKRQEEILTGDKATTSEVASRKRTREGEDMPSSKRPSLGEGIREPPWRAFQQARTPPTRRVPVRSQTDLQPRRFRGGLPWTRPHVPSEPLLGRELFAAAERRQFAANNPGVELPPRPQPLTKETEVQQDGLAQMEVEQAPPNVTETPRSSAWLGGIMNSVSQSLSRVIGRSPERVAQPPPPNNAAPTEGTETAEQGPSQVTNSQPFMTFSSEEEYLAAQQAWITQYEKDKEQNSDQSDHAEETQQERVKRLQRAFLKTHKRYKKRERLMETPQPGEKRKRGHGIKFPHPDFIPGRTSDGRGFEMNLDEYKSSDEASSEGDFHPDDVSTPTTGSDRTLSTGYPTKRPTKKVKFGPSPDDSPSKLRAAQEALDLANSSNPSSRASSSYLGRLETPTLPRGRRLNALFNQGRLNRASLNKPQRNPLHQFVPGGLNPQPRELEWVDEPSSASSPRFRKQNRTMMEDPQVGPSITNRPVLPATNNNVPTFSAHAAQQVANAQAQQLREEIEREEAEERSRAEAQPPAEEQSRVSKPITYGWNNLDEYDSDGEKYSDDDQDIVTEATPTTALHPVAPSTPLATTQTADSPRWTDAPPSTPNPAQITMPGKENEAGSEVESTRPYLLTALERHKPRVGSRLSIISRYSSPLTPIDLSLNAGRQLSEEEQVQAAVTAITEDQLREYSGPEILTYLEAGRVTQSVMDAIDRNWSEEAQSTRTEMFDQEFNAYRVEEQNLIESLAEEGSEIMEQEAAQEYDREYDLFLTNQSAART